MVGQSEHLRLHVKIGDCIQQIAHFCRTVTPVLRVLQSARWHFFELPLLRTSGSTELLTTDNFVGDVLPSTELLTNVAVQN